MYHKTYHFVAELALETKPVEVNDTSSEAEANDAFSAAKVNDASSEAETDSAWEMFWT